MVTCGPRTGLSCLKQTDLLPSVRSSPGDELLHMQFKDEENGQAIMSGEQGEGRQVG